MGEKKSLRWWRQLTKSSTSTVSIKNVDFEPAAVGIKTSYKVTTLAFRDQEILPREIAEIGSKSTWPLEAISLTERALRESGEKKRTGLRWRETEQRELWGRVEKNRTSANALNIKLNFKEVDKVKIWFLVSVWSGEEND